MFFSIKKILLLFYFFACIFSVLSLPINAHAQNFTYLSGENNGEPSFLIPDFADYVGGRITEQAIRNKLPLFIRSDRAIIAIPAIITTEDLNFVPSDRDMITAWQGIENLYKLIASSSIATPNDKLMASDSAATLDRVLTSYTVKVVGRIEVSPKTVYQKQSVTAHGEINSTRTDLKCYFYVGDGNGRYLFMGGPKDITDCNFTWQTSTETTADPGHNFHSVGITFQPANWNKPATLQTLPGPYASDIVTVLKEGTAPPLSGATPDVNLQANMGKVALPKAAGQNYPILTAYIPNAYDSSMQGKSCYIYIGNGNGGWILKYSGPVDNCAFQWDYSGSSLGDHGFIANVQTTGKVDGDPTLLPKSSIVTITVCNSNDSACLKTSSAGGSSDNSDANPNPDNSNKPTNTGGSSSESGTGNSGGSSSFSAAVSPSRLLSIAGVKPQLGSIEGVFAFLLQDVFPLLIGLLAFAAMVYGGFQIMTSAGDNKLAETGKKTLTYGVIGMVVAALSFAIITVVVSILKGIGVTS